jgi:hypothetical protein
MWLFYPELMYMPFLTLRKKYFSKEVGGGDLGVATGIVQNTMITDGLIIVILHLGIKQYLVIGDIITATISGVVVLGILLTSITAILIIIGVVVIGVMTMDGDVLAVVGMDAP